MRNALRTLASLPTLALLFDCLQPAFAQSYGLYQTCQLQTAMGQAVSGAQVYFLTQPANPSSLTPQAQVYSSSSGGAVSQPLTTNGFGQCSAYLAPGVYTVVYVSPYTGTQIFPDQNVAVGGGAPSSPAFGSIQSGTNSTAAMNVAAGAAINATGGVVEATAIDGVAVTGTPATGQVLTATSPTAAAWGNPSGAYALLNPSGPQTITNSLSNTFTASALPSTSVAPSGSLYPNSVATLYPYEFVTEQGTAPSLLYTYNFSSGVQVPVGAPLAFGGCQYLNGIVITNINGVWVLFVTCEDLGAGYAFSINPATGALSSLGSVTGLTNAYPGSVIDPANPGYVFVPLFGVAAVSNGAVAKVLLSSSGAPVLVSTTSVAGYAGGSSYPFQNPASLASYGGYILIETGHEPPSGNDSTLQVLNESTMALVGSPFVAAHSPQQIVTQGNVAYVSYYDSEEVQAVSISPAGALTSLDTLPLSCHAQGIIVRARYAYVGCVLENQVMQIDISNPANMRLAQTFSGIGAQRLWLDGRWLFVTEFTAGGNVYLADTGGFYAQQVAAGNAYVNDLQAATFNASNASVTGNLNGQPMNSYCTATNGLCAGSGGIAQLTGDATAGPGTGSQAATVVRVDGVSFPASPSVNTVPVVTTGGGSPAVTYEAVPNAALANAAATVNGQSCALGGSCTVAAAAGALTGSALASGVTSAPGLTSAAGGSFGTAAFDAATSFLQLANTVDQIVTLSADSGVNFVDNSSGTILEIGFVAGRDRVSTHSNILDDGSGFASALSWSLNGSQPVAGIQGTTGTSLAATTGSFTSGHCRQTDTNGNEVDSGAACGGGSGTVFQQNGTSLSSSATVNFQTGSGNGGVVVTNPSAGNVAFNLSKPIAGSGSGFTTGPTTTGAGDIAAFNDVHGTLVDTEVQISSVLTASEGIEENCLPLGTGGQVLVTSLFCDNGADGSYSGAGGFGAPSLSASGLTTAGIVTNTSAGLLGSETKVTAAQGGTNLNSSSSSGIPRVTSGTWSVIDFPEHLVIPAANCTNTTAGAGWSIGASGTVTCRGGTNNQGGYISITDTSSSFAQFYVQLPEDWDTATLPYIRFQLAYPGTDGASAHTIIPQIRVSCIKGDGSTTDDVTFATAHSLSTITLSSATANLFFGASDVQLNSTDMSGCVAGSGMIVQVGRATDTATSAANFYSATITIPRLPVNQAN